MKGRATIEWNPMQPEGDRGLLGDSCLVLRCGTGGLMLKQLKRGLDLGPSGSRRRRRLVAMLVLIVLALGGHSWWRSSRIVASLPGTWVGIATTGESHEWVFGADGSLTRRFSTRPYRITCSNDWYIVGNRLVCSTRMPGTSVARGLWDDLVTSIRRQGPERFRVVSVDDQFLTLAPDFGMLTGLGTVHLTRRPAGQESRSIRLE